MEDSFKNSEQWYRRQLGIAIKRAREAQGLSLRSLALMSNVDYKYLWRIEHGNANVTVNVLIKLGASLEKKVSEFFSFETDEARP